MTNPQLSKNRLELDAGEPSNSALAEMAMAGGAFDDLAAEPDLYSFSDGTWSHLSTTPGLLRSLRYASHTLRRPDPRRPAPEVSYPGAAPRLPAIPR